MKAFTDAATGLWVTVLLQEPQGCIAHPFPLSSDVEFEDPHKGSDFFWLMVSGCVSADFS